MWRKTLTIALALALTLGAASTAAAQGGQTENVEFTGTVVSINPGEGSFQAETEEGDVYTVVPAEGFDFSTLSEGDLVEVEGTLTQTGQVAADKVSNESNNENGGKGQDKDKDKDKVKDEGEKQSNGKGVCEGTKQHPMAASIAERYGVAEDSVAGWFCEGFGFGEIMLALQTGLLSEGSDPGSLLAQKKADGGWGKIWQELGLIGKPEDAKPPDHAGPKDKEDKDWLPEQAGPKEKEDKDGKPDQAGPKDKEDKDWLPDQAGPKD